MSKYPQSELDRIFTYHGPKGDQPQRYESIRKAARDFAQTLIDLSPASVELDRAITHIECAVFWANAGVARNE